MTESMIVEAVRSAAAAPSAPGVAPTAPSAPSPSSVARFNAAMGAEGPAAADPVPFVSETAASWRSAQANNQGILHRIRALSDMRGRHNVAALEMMELQYEVMNLAFQQEVVAKVADKSSNAIQTLVKNQ